MLLVWLVFPWAEPLAGQPAYNPPKDNKPNTRKQSISLRGLTALNQNKIKFYFSWLAHPAAQQNVIQFFHSILFHCRSFTQQIKNLKFSLCWFIPAAYRGPSAIPLLALHVINFMYLFILHKNIQLWLLDSYPLHINYCYNIFSLHPFHQNNWRNEQSEKKSYFSLSEVNGVDWLMKSGLLHWKSKIFKLRSDWL